MVRMAHPAAGNVTAVQEWKATWRLCLPRGAVGMCTDSVHAKRLIVALL